MARASDGDNGIDCEWFQLLEGWVDDGDGRGRESKLYRLNDLQSIVFFGMMSRLIVHSLKQVGVGLVT